MDKLPVFNSDGLLVRGFVASDLQLVEKASQDPLIPLISSVPSVYSKEEGLAYIARQQSRHLHACGGYAFAVADAGTNTAMGSIYVGLSNIIDGRASLGYWLVKDYRGKKIIIRALKPVIDWLFTERKIPRLQLYAEPWNKPSIKTAEHLGFQQEGLMRSWQQVGNERKDMIMFSRLRGE